MNHLINELYRYFKSQPSARVLQDLFNDLSEVFCDNIRCKQFLESNFSSDESAARFFSTMGKMSQNQKVSVKGIENFLYHYFLIYPEGSNSGLQNILFGLKKLVKSNALSGKIDAAEIMQLLDILNCHPNGRKENLADALKIAEILLLNNQMYGSFQVRLINRLMDRFTYQVDMDAKSFSMAFRAFGNMVKFNMLSSAPDETLVRHMFYRLSSLTILESIAISGVFFGMEQFVDRGIVWFQLDADYINELLSQMIIFPITNSFKITDIFNCLSKISDRNLLQGKIDANIVNELIRSMNQLQELSSKKIYLNLQSIKKLGFKKHIEGGLLAQDLFQLFEKLMGQNLGFHIMYDNYLCFLETIVNANIQNYEPINMKLVINFMKSSSLSRFSPGFIEQFLRASAILAKNNPNIAIDQEFISECMMFLINHKYLNTAIRLDLLQMIQHLNLSNQKSLVAQVLETELSNLDALSVPHQAAYLNMMEQHRDTSMGLAIQNKFRLGVLQHIDYTIEPSHLDNQELANQEVNPLRLSEVQHIDYSIERSHLDNQDLANQEVNPLANPDIRNIVPEPRVEKRRKLFSDFAMQQQIFRLIVERDYDGLMALLAVKLPSPRILPSPSNSHSFFDSDKLTSKRSPRIVDDVLLNKQKLAEKMVRQFFKKIDEKSLKRLIANRDHHYFELLLRACSFHTRYQLAIQNVLEPLCLYIRFNELEAMVKSFRTLTFYRDHGALISLLNALKMRESAMTDENEIIECRRLRIEFLSTGIDYHTKSKNHNVERILKNLYNDMNNENSEENDSESIESDNSVPELRLNLGLFRPTAMTHLNGQINLAHLYTAEDINRILNRRCQDIPGVAVMGAVALNQLQMPELLRNGLVQNLEARVILYPMCISNHWVGIAIYRRDNGFDIRFYDSLTSEERENDIRAQVMPTLHEVLGENIMWSAMNNPYIQNDITSCGAYLIENMCLDMQPNLARQVWTSETIRQAHIHLIQQSNQPELANSNSSAKRKERDEDILPTAKFYRKQG